MDERFVRGSGPKLFGVEADIVSRLFRHLHVVCGGIHSYVIYDTLYGIDGKNEPRPRMCAGHELSADPTPRD